MIDYIIIFTGIFFDYAIILTKPEMCNLHSGIFENTFNNILINEISSLSTPDIKNSLVIISTLGWVSVFSGTTPGSKKY